MIKTRIVVKAIRAGRSAYHISNRHRTTKKKKATNLADASRRLSTRNPGRETLSAEMSMRLRAAKRLDVGAASTNLPLSNLLRANGPLPG
jgi:hypothetical protein